MVYLRRQERWLYLGNHARASSGGASRRSGVRRRNGRCSGIFGESGGDGASAAAKTKQLGRYDTKPEEELETARREVTMKPGYGGTWVLREDLLSLHRRKSRFRRY